jgi:hypothetical protein
LRFDPALHIEPTALFEKALAQRNKRLAEDRDAMPFVLYRIS